MKVNKINFGTAIDVGNLNLISFFRRKIPKHQEHRLDTDCVR